MTTPGEGFHVDVNALKDGLSVCAVGAVFDARSWELAGADRHRPIVATGCMSGCGVGRQGAPPG